MLSYLAPARCMIYECRVGGMPSYLGLNQAPCCKQDTVHRACHSRQAFPTTEGAGSDSKCALKVIPQAQGAYILVTRVPWSTLHGMSCLTNSLER